MLMCALESHLKVTSVISLCDPKDYSSPGSSCPWDSLGTNTRVGCHGELPKPRTEPASPALQLDSLDTEPPCECECP